MKVSIPVPDFQVGTSIGTSKTLGLEHVPLVRSIRYPRMIPFKERLGAGGVRKCPLVNALSPSRRHSRIEMDRMVYSISFDSIAMWYLLKGLGNGG